MPTLFTDADRRRRLVARHHLARTASGSVDVASSVAALHSSDPATPYLASWSRVPGFAISDLDEALYQSRRLRRMHTIRRTLFLVPLDDVPSFEAGAAREVARRERVKLQGWLAVSMPEQRIAPWLDELTNGVLEILEGGELTTRELNEAVPDLGTKVTLGSRKWLSEMAIGSWVLKLMAMDGLIVRTRPVGTWRSSQYAWATEAGWHGARHIRVAETDGRIGIARRYLETHGPVTITDLRWWTGWTLGQTKAALNEIESEEVILEDGETGIALDGDVDVPDFSGPVISFLPALDPTPMGWKKREWYVGPHADQVFDTNGNVGPTVWLDGRIVGGWGQRPDGEVVFELLEGVGPDVVSRVGLEAADLSRWLDGVVVMPRFPSPLGKRLAQF